MKSTARTVSDALRYVPSPLTVEFRAASSDEALTERYLTEILRPGITHPVERAFLYNADYQSLSAARAIIGAGWVGDEIAAGCYITVDDTGTAWINGVRVHDEWRGHGFGSAMVREALAYIADDLRIDRCALTVLCDEQGNPGKPAFDIYEECGFRQVKQPYPLIVSGALRDRHLGAVGAEFLSVRMETGS